MYDLATSVGAIRVGDDLFGSAVQLAARICGVAEADVVLVSREVRDACGDINLTFQSAGSRALKGFAEAVEVFSPAR